MTNELFGHSGLLLSCPYVGTLRGAFQSTQLSSKACLSKGFPMGPVMGPVDSGGVYRMGTYVEYGRIHLITWYILGSRLGAHTKGP